MRTCTCCKSSRREEIDRAIITNQSVRDIAGRYRVSKSAVDRHRAHIQELVRANVEQRVETLENDLQRAEGRLESLYSTAEAVLKAAVAARDPRAALASIRTAIGVLGEARQLAELKGAKKLNYEARNIDRDLEDLLLYGKVRKNRADALEELNGPI